MDGKWKKKWMWRGNAGEPSRALQTLPRLFSFTLCWSATSLTSPGPAAATARARVAMRWVRAGLGGGGESGGGGRVRSLILCLCSHRQEGAVGAGQAGTVARTHARRHGAREPRAGPECSRE